MHKSLEYQRSKLWTIMPNDLKIKGHFVKYNVDLNFFLKEQLNDKRIDSLQSGINIIRP